MVSASQEFAQCSSGQCIPSVPYGCSHTSAGLVLSEGLFGARGPTSNVLSLHGWRTGSKLRILVSSPPGTLPGTKYFILETRGFSLGK